MYELGSKPFARGKPWLWERRSCCGAGCAEEHVGEEWWEWKCDCKCGSTWPTYGDEACDPGMKDPVDHLLFAASLPPVGYGADRTFKARDGEGEARPLLPLRTDIWPAWRGDITGESGVVVVDIVSGVLWV